MEKWQNVNEQYYDEIFLEYAKAALAMDLSHLYLPFLELIPNGGKILDAGCGPGRDTKIFLEKGYEVDAFDLSGEMAKFASEYSGIKVQKNSFTEIDVADVYDGVWCSASLLHIPSENLKEVFSRLSATLKRDGILYASFKLGSFEGVRMGRLFNDMNAGKISNLLPDTAQIINTWQTNDIRKNRENEKWFNIILKNEIRK